MPQTAWVSPWLARGVLEGLSDVLVFEIPVVIGAVPELHGVAKRPSKADSEQRAVGVPGQALH